MIKKKIKIIEKILDFLYPSPKSKLYFINKYTLLLSIILTSRSREKKVNEITKNIFNHIKSPYNIIKLSIQEIENLIRKVGIHKIKSKNIYNLSLILIQKYKGSIPTKISELKKLPGIGNKNASVFLYHIFKKPIFPVDTHINRMMYRWNLSNERKIKKTEEKCKIFFKKKIGKNYIYKSFFMVENILHQIIGIKKKI